MPARARKTVLDAWNRHHNLQLSPASQDSTTFISEWHRYAHLRAIQGFHASRVGYIRRFDDIRVNVIRKIRCIDDSLLWGDSIGSSFWYIMEYIIHCGKIGIVFNPDKFHFADNGGSLPGS